MTPLSLTGWSARRVLVLALRLTEADVWATAATDDGPGWV